MKALRYFGARDIRHDDMPDPRLEFDRDAIVRMTACSICGSDLHIYHGHGFSEDIGFCVGHEAVGEVVEVGSGGAPAEGRRHGDDARRGRMRRVPLVPRGQRHRLRQ